MRILPRAIFSFAVLGLAACPSAERKATRDRPNVLLIAIDTLRADKLGCYGNAGGLSPNVDTLAAQGVRFEHAFAHAPWTLPSFASLFSSLYPEQHGAGGNVSQPFRTLREEIETLPEHLREQGYATHAIVNVDFLGPSFGVTQGFASVDAFAAANNRDVRDATATTTAALAWLDGHAQKPFMLFVHYFDPHAEYAPPEPWRSRFASAEDAGAGSFEFGTRDQIVRHRNRIARLPEGSIRRAEHLYEGEIAYTDSEIGRLLAGLAQRGLDPTTLVVLTADHGEEFFDHGDYEHGHTLYDELIRVPLILRQTGRLAPRTVAEPVGHVDVAPTICALLGLAPAPGFAGQDVGAALDGRACAPSPLVAFGSFWGPPLESLRDENRKLIQNPAPRSPRLELYDWRADPREMRDLGTSELDRADLLRTNLELLSKAFARRAHGPGPRAELSDAERRHLHGLGYAGDGEPEPHAGGDEAADLDTQKPR